ncbi:MAG TPA: alpha/beta fold hydrolase [Micromonosporaceae bacterium]|nr:alpha/beta fold hydrolase [Micromonosporaceae bacterium]
MSSSPTLSVVCFPHAGGGFGRYREWRDGLPDGVELVLPDLPGREGRLFDKPFPDVASVTEYAIQELAAEITRSDKLAIAGISYGAFVAFDMAARLEASGKRVHAVFAASQRAPTTPLPRINWHLMDDDELLADLVEIGGLSQDMAENKEFVELFLPVLRAELHASEIYRKPDAYDRLRCPIYFYYGKEDAMIPPSAARAWRDETDHFAWRGLDAAHFLTGTDGDDLWYKALVKDLGR